MTLLLLLLACSPPTCAEGQAYSPVFDQCIGAEALAPTTPAPTSPTGVTGDTGR